MCVLLWISKFQTNCQHNLTSKLRALYDNTVMETSVRISAGIVVLINFMQIKKILLYLIMYIQWQTKKFKQEPVNYLP